MPEEQESGRTTVKPANTIQICRLSEAPDWVLARSISGLWLSKGFGTHMTWRCFGLGDITSGMEQDRGYCAATDPTGDQLVADVASDEKYPPTRRALAGSSRLRRAPESMAGSAEMGHLHVTGESSGRRLREPTPITAPIRAVTKYRSRWDKRRVAAIGVGPPSRGPASAVAH